MSQGHPQIMLGENFRPNFYDRISQLRYPFESDTEKYLRIYQEYYKENGKGLLAFIRAYYHFNTTIALVHWHYLAVLTAIGPICITVLVTKIAVRILIHNRFGVDEQVRYVEDFKRRTWYNRLLDRKWPSLKKILQTLEISLPSKSFTFIPGNKLSQELVAIDSEMIMTKHKIGVCFFTGDERNFTEILKVSSENISAGFWNFIEFLGTEIKLFGWPAYSGNLDTSKEQTDGKTSIYRDWNGREIMFHVSPFIPMKETDTQAVSRKRILGNDRVLIIVTSRDVAIDLRGFHCRQIHVVFLVLCRHDAQATIRVVHLKGMPDFPLYIDDRQPIFLNHRDDQDRFVASLIEADMAALKSKEYQQVMTRARVMKLTDLCYKYL